MFQLCISHLEQRTPDASLIRHSAVSIGKPRAGSVRSDGTMAGNKRPAIRQNAEPHVANDPGLPQHAPHITLVPGIGGR